MTQSFPAHNIRLDVVTTATLRPDLLEITFRSFHNRLLHKFPNRRLILNIDPLPSTDSSLLHKTLEVSGRWFPEVIYRYPETPSFPVAVRWAWSAVEADLIFHLEDDWLLMKDIDPIPALSLFDTSPTLAAITLNPSRNKGTPPGLSLRPSFIRRAFLTDALPLFDVTQDPERQWRTHTVIDGALSGWKFSYLGHAGEGRHIRHMGSVWRKAFAFRKWEGGEVTWGKSTVPIWKRYMAHAKLRLSMALWSACAGTTLSLRQDESGQPTIRRIIA